MTMTPYPEFEDPAFLREHVESILAFYEPNVCDADGGSFNIFWMMAAFMTATPVIWSAVHGLFSITPTPCF